MRLLRVLALASSLLAAGQSVQLGQGAQMGQRNNAPLPSVPQTPSADNPFPRNNNGAEAPLDPSTRERLEKGRQSERQRKMMADTDHLLALAQQLKAEMDKTTKDTLSIDVIKKAEEIERLAHSVKERMKG